MKINIEALKQDVRPFLDDKFYDTIIEACYLLFAPNRIKIDKNLYTVTITDTIYLKLNFSGNESKVYFSSMPMTEELVRVKDYLNMEIAASFRVFRLEEVIAYLELKKEEANWIKNNQG